MNTKSSVKNRLSLPVRTALPLKIKGFITKKDFHHFSDLHGEEYFTSHYNIECKRSERSGIPFLLLLVNVANLTSAGVHRFLTPIEKVLADNKREYDHIGWYETGKIIGIIFYDFAHSDARVIHHRLLESLRMSIGHAPTGMLSLSLYRITGTIRERVATTDEYGAPRLETSSTVFYQSSFRKRTVDFSGALFGILFFTPAFIIIALFVKITSKGPVLFRQNRVGKDGKLFTMYKFRSMYVNNDEAAHREYMAKLIKGQIEGETGKNGERIFKLTSDPRITPVGRFLRKTSLDEIPQFFNVLKGDMSLVGPRPALGYEVDQYDLWHRRRVIAKPGITGFWQLNGRSLTTFDGMVRMDINYIERSTLLSDLILIFKTPFILLGAKGAL
ncbi:MAG: sugar transferase [Chitinispirillaceae bacterium]|nr:sugar transferase [Chitinispirillaceae bacterium]